MSTDKNFSDDDIASLVNPLMIDIVTSPKRLNNYLTHYFEEAGSSPVLSRIMASGSQIGSSFVMAIPGVIADAIVSSSSTNSPSVLLAITASVLAFSAPAIKYFEATTGFEDEEKALPRFSAALEQLREEHDGPA